MTKRLIICADNRSPYNKEDTYFKYCVGLTQVYANKHKIDFLFEELKSVPEGRHWSWARILLLAKHYPNYDEILWLDTDATIINHTVDVFQFMKSAPSSDWLRDPTQKPILYACRNRPDNKTICDGILLLDCSNKGKVKEMLNDWWNDVPNDSVKTQWPWNETVINQVWREHPIKRNYIKGIEVESFFELSETQVFIHLTSSFYYSNELRTHEAKKYTARQLTPKYKKIGIFVRQQNFYTSGCGQNCIFIKQSLELLGYIVDLLVENFDGRAVLPTKGVPAKKEIISDHHAIFYKDYKTVKLDEYEVLIFGSVVPSQHIITLAKSMNIKTVMFHPMNSMDALHIDAFVYPQKADTVPLFESNFHKLADEVWLTDNHEKTMLTYLNVLNNFKIPIKPIRLTWSPLFVAPSKTPSYYEKRTATQIEFVIIEPNMSFWKNAWMPLMIAEYVHKHFKNVKMVHLYNAPQDKTVIDQLQIVKDNKLTQHPRIQINEIINRFAKTDTHVIFLSHQINVPLNYAYFDILSSGFPFIHNSESLKEAKQGYFYTSLETAAAAVQSILTQFNTVEARNEAKSYLDSIHPGNKEVLQHISSLLSTPALKTNNKKIQIVVLTVNKERELFMRKQLDDMKLPFPVEFFQGYTPETSKEFLASKEENAKEPNGLICCFRSYASVFNSFKSRTYDYLLTLEDDVLLLKNFVVKLNEIIDSWKADIDYISLGYLLSLNTEELKTCEQKKSLYFNNLPSNWGTQAMLFKPETVDKLAQILHFPTFRETRNSLDKYGKENKLFRNRTLYVSADAVLPTILNQGLVFPPLVIESPQFMSIVDTKENNSNRPKITSINTADYYA